MLIGHIVRTSSTSPRRSAGPRAFVAPPPGAGQPAGGLCHRFDRRRSKRNRYARTYHPPKRENCQVVERDQAVGVPVSGVPSRLAAPHNPAQSRQVVLDIIPNAVRYYPWRQLSNYARRFKCVLGVTCMTIRRLTALSTQCHSAVMLQTALRHGACSAFARHAIGRTAPAGSSSSRRSCQTQATAVRPSRD